MKIKALISFHMSMGYGISSHIPQWSHYYNPGATSPPTSGGSACSFRQGSALSSFLSLSNGLRPRLPDLSTGRFRPFRAHLLQHAWKTRPLSQERKENKWLISRDCCLWATTWQTTSFESSSQHVTYTMHTLKAAFPACSPSALEKIFIHLYCGLTPASN